MVSRVIGCRVMGCFIVVEFGWCLYSVKCDFCCVLCSL